MFFLPILLSNKYFLTDYGFFFTKDLIFDGVDDDISTKLYTLTAASYQ